MNATTASGFPDFLKALPQADLPFAGLRGWLIQGEQLLLLNESDVDLQVPAHAHGNQWGVVLAGAIELQIGGETRTYQRGDTYWVPKGIQHSARIFAGFRALDIFEDRERYRAKDGIS